MNTILHNLLLTMMTRKAINALSPIMLWMHKLSSFHLFINSKANPLYPYHNQKNKASYSSNSSTSSNHALET